MNNLQTRFPRIHQGIMVMLITFLSFSALNACSLTLPPATPTTIPTMMPTRVPTLIPTVTASGPRTYFVDNNLGSDSNPGTQARPLYTIQMAANMTHAGDTVIVLAGTYNERVYIAKSGASGASITYQAQGQVVMQGFTIKANYIGIKGFEITNTPDDDQEGFGVFVQGGDCDIEDNYVYFATRGGIQLNAASDHCTVRNNRLYRDSQFGIGVAGLDHLIEGNEIWDSIQYHPKWLNPPGWVDADGIRFFGSGHILRGNYIHDISYKDPLNINPHIDCFQTFSDANHKAASNVTIEQNRCDNDELAKSIGQGGTGFTMEGASKIMIRNNVINAFVDVFLQNCDGVSILNNTLIGNTMQDPAYYPVGISLNQTSGVVIQNNILYDQPDNVIYVKGNQPISGKNMVFRDDGRPVSTTDTYNPVNDLWGIDPMFVAPATNDYHLQSGSPAIDAGLNLGSLVPDDFDGVSRPQTAGYDIGAYEY